MDPSSLTVVVLLEGLRDELLLEMPFLREASSRAEPLSPLAASGLCPAPPPPYEYDPAASPFAAAAFFPPEHSLTPASRTALRDALAQHSGAPPAAIPLPLLPFFRPSAPAAAQHLSDGAALLHSFRQIGPQTELAVFHLSLLGQAARLHGPGSRPELEAAQHLDRLLRLLAENLQARGLHPQFAAICHQPPINVVRRVDLPSSLAASGASWPTHFACLIEPALARFWFNSQHTRSLVRQALDPLDCGHWLPGPHPAAALFAALPGVAFDPDFLEDRSSPLHGIDSYHDSVALPGFAIRWGRDVLPARPPVHTPPDPPFLARLLPLLDPADTLVCLPGQPASIRVVGKARDLPHDWAALAATLSREFNIEGLEIEWVWAPLLDRPARTLEIYDLSRGDILWGQPDLLESVERFAVAEIPPASAERRLARGIAQLGDHPLALARAGAAAADRLLLAWRAYHAHPAHRLRLWRLLAPAARFPQPAVDTLAACYGHLLGQPAPTQSDVLQAIRAVAPDALIATEHPCP